MADQISLLETAYRANLHLKFGMSVLKGARFEARVLEYFSKYPFNLNQKGGPNDRGIDIRGKLILETTRYDTIIQCKHESGITAPKYIRELEGVVSREDCIGILCTHQSWSRNAIKYCQYSQMPMMGCVLNDQDVRIWLNLALQRRIPLLGIGTMQGKSVLFYNKKPLIYPL